MNSVDDPSAANSPLPFGSIRGTLVFAQPETKIIAIPANMMGIAMLCRLRLIAANLKRPFRG